MADKEDIKKLFKQKNLFAIHHGDYAGQIFAFIKKEEQSYNFLSMPDMKNISVPDKDIDEGIKKEIVKFCNECPDEVFKVIEAQYKKNENTND